MPEKKFLPGMHSHVVRFNSNSALTFKVPISFWSALLSSPNRFMECKMRLSHVVSMMV